MAYQTGPRSESHLPGVTFLATNLSSHRHNKRANPTRRSAFLLLLSRLPDISRTNLSPALAEAIRVVHFVYNCVPICLFHLFMLCSPNGRRY